MPEFDQRQFIAAALEALVDGLRPYVAQRFAELTPELRSWTDVLERKDRRAGRHQKRYNPNDLSLLLRALTEGLGNLGYPFSGVLSREASNCASELRTVRNKWAHYEDFTTAETYRALDSAEILLRAIGANATAEPIGTLKSATLAAMASERRADPAVAGAEPTVSAESDTPEPMTGAPPTTRITVESLPALSYAQARGSIPVVDEVTIDYDGPELRGAYVEVEVVCELGALGDPKVVLVDLNGTTPTTLRNADLLLDPARMLGVDSPMQGEVRVRLCHADSTVVAQQRSPVEILAANQWKARPSQLGLELLAAFVQPNSPAIDPLLTEASDHLQAKTGFSSLDGYQQGSRERVDAIAEAIYESMRARGIRYAEPPASWGIEGQKVRTPTEVLDQRLGTCLDTTVTFAAALEQAGINSTLWLLEGHIFLGYWRDDATLDGPGQSDIAEVLNYVGLDQIRLVETTLLTGGPMSSTFADAVRRPHVEHLADGPSRVVGVADLKQARLARIYPLPSRSVAESGEVVVHEYRIDAAPDALHYSPEPGAREVRPKHALPSRVAQWKNALLDLSLRNRLINYSDKAGYPLAIPQPSVPVLEDMINGGVSLTLVPSDQIPVVDRTRGTRYGQDLPETDRTTLLVQRKSAFIGVTEAAYATRLRALAYKARTIVEETGANNLYLAFGMLRWVFNDRELRSPLVLVPVTLKPAAPGQKFQLTLDDTGESTPNYCLLEKLRVSFELEIPGLADPIRDEAGIDLPAAFAATRHALAKARLPFTVEDSVELSILQFAKFRLWKDLDDNWEGLAESPLVSHLIHTPTAPFTDPAPAPESIDLDALGNAVPVAADSSQLDAVAEATADRTFVLEGPPGTGKSQTITNLLAHAVANGKRVLFVAEKRAALDVVKDRLDAVGLGPFSLDLHDKGARPNAVRTQIGDAMDAVAHPDGAALKANTEAAIASRGSLRRYAERLHATNGAGLSLYSARNQLLASAEDVEPLPMPTTFVADSAEERFELVRGALRTLPETADLAHPSPLHPWGFIDTIDRKLDTSRVHSAACEFDSALIEARAKGGDAFLTDAATPAAVERWAHLARAPRHPLTTLDALYARVRSGEVRKLVQELRVFAASPPSWLTTLGAEALDGDAHGIHAEALAADASGFFGRKKRRRAALARYGTALKVDLLQYPPRDISTLTADVAATAAAVQQLRDALASLPLNTAPPGWNPFLRRDAQDAAENLEWGAWIGAALNDDTDPQVVTERLRKYYQETPPRLDLAEALGRVAETWQALAAACALPAPTRGDDPMTAWGDDRGFIGAWEATRSARRLDTPTPATLDRWVAFVEALDPLRADGLIEARRMLLAGDVPADLASLAFDKGVAAASVKEREESEAMSAFDVHAHNRTVDRFTRSASEIRAELPRWVPAEIIAKRRINPSYEGGRMGELRRQLGRRRGGMSVRALFENYGDLITQIAPCVLMSPESVARFFPAKAGMFDITVFDEASQIRVADAVGAMGRGRSVVVVGDSKQMPPTSFAEVSNDIGIDTVAAADAVADEESILTECVQARVPRKWLSWHYRSQDEALITFSNHAYYDNRLSSFPAPWPDTAESADHGHGVSMVRVNGHFNRSGKGSELRTNAVEAAAIVDEVSRRFAASPGATPSLGIITFNAQQRTLIETLLRTAPDERIAGALDERDGLFVKNLENVQGDERDTILFSVAFSANDRGVIPLNFGPLSRAGGERRLNVAITRARRQVILFASFDPSELRAEETASVGVKHLKAYLEFATSGIESTTDGTRRERRADRHRDEIADELRHRGYAVKTDVGLSDFRVDISIAAEESPDQPLVAVLLDGEQWRERRTVADRDGLPIAVLKELMRWPGVERVWLPEWLQQRDLTLQRLESAVALAAASLQAGGPDAFTAPVVEKTAPPVTDHPDLVRSAHPAAQGATLPQHELRHPCLRQFTGWEPRRRGTTDTLDQLPSPSAAGKVAATIREAVEHEGPIHKIRLVKLVAESFGLSRVASARSTAILRCLPPEYLRPTDRACAWPQEADPESWREARRSSPGDGRNLDHVPFVEIANAMAIVAELGGGMTKDELKREALAMFGGRRVTEKISARLDAGLEIGMDSGRLRRDSRGLLQPVVQSDSKT